MSDVRPVCVGAVDSCVNPAALRGFDPLSPRSVLPPLVSLALDLTSGRPASPAGSRLPVGGTCAAPVTHRFP